MEASKLWRIAENELEKHLTVRSQRRLRVRFSFDADPRWGRELLVQRRGSTDPGVRVRLVATNELDQDLNGDPVIAVDFPVAVDIDGPESRRYWFIFAYLCEAHLGFAEPIYIVPAPALKRFVDHERRASGSTVYSFRGPMVPGDELWDHFAFSIDDLATAVLGALQRLEDLENLPSPQPSPARGEDEDRDRAA
jgi:hypothetical protein